MGQEHLPKLVFTTKQLLLVHVSAGLNGHELQQVGNKTPTASACMLPEQNKRMAQHYRTPPVIGHKPTLCHLSMR